jgi:hypothetical protein
MSAIRVSGGLAALTSMLSLAGAQAEDDWQTQRLLQPKAHHLQQEQRGQVFIYDGLNEATVDQAMDKQFRRIDSMMFIRTVLPPTAAGGAEEITDPECD